MLSCVVLCCVVLCIVVLCCVGMKLNKKMFKEEELIIKLEENMFTASVVVSVSASLRPATAKIVKI